MSHQPFCPLITCLTTGLGSNQFNDLSKSARRGEGPLFLPDVTMPPAVLPAVDREYQRAYNSIGSTPGAAVTAACAIVEAVCKHHLETENIPLPNKQTIALLATEVARTYASPQAGYRR